LKIGSNIVHPNSHFLKHFCLIEIHASHVTDNTDEKVKFCDEITASISVFSTFLRSDRNDEEIGCIQVIFPFSIDKCRIIHKVIFLGSLVSVLHVVNRGEIAIKYAKIVALLMIYVLRVWANMYSHLIINNSTRVSSHLKAIIRYIRYGLEALCKELMCFCSGISVWISNKPLDVTKNNLQQCIVISCFLYLWSH